MLLLTLVAQPLAVVGEQHDERLVPAPEALQLLEQLPHHRVGGRDLSVVRLAVARGERLGRLVGGVRLVEVQEEQERALADLAQPGQQPAQRLAARPLQAVTTARAMARTAWSYPSRLAIYDGDAGQIAELRTRPGELAPIA